MANISYAIGVGSSEKLLLSSRMVKKLFTRMMQFDLSLEKVRFGQGGKREDTQTV